MLTFDGQVKVLDFGIALHRERKSQATELGSIRGKAAYIAPEVLLGEPPSRQADVWALGVVLHELLLGQPLFSRERDLATMHAVLNEPIKSPRELVPAVSEALAAATLRALARPLKERFQTAAELAATLEPIARSAPLDAWAHEALRDHRLEHERWLKQRLTEPEPLPDSPSAPALATPGGREAPTLTLRGLSPAASRRSGWPMTAAVAALLALFVGGVLLSRGPASQAQADAGSPVPAALLPPVDEADAGPSTSEVADAGEAADGGEAQPIDAGPGRQDAGRPRPRKPPREAPVPAPFAVVVPGPVEFSTVSVLADPYGLVRIDGKLLGPTPLFGTRIEAGPHRIELVAPDTGEVRAVRTPTLAPNTSLTVDFR
jgi:hypothetical protein